MTTAATIELASRGLDAILEEAVEQGWRREGVYQGLLRLRPASDRQVPALIPESISSLEGLVQIVEKLAGRGFRVPGEPETDPVEEDRQRRRDLLAVPIHELVGVTPKALPPRRKPQLDGETTPPAVTRRTEPEKEAAMTAEAPTELLPYPCPDCDRAFSRPQGLGRHRLSVHDVPGASRSRGPAAKKQKQARRGSVPAPRPPADPPPAAAARHRRTRHSPRPTARACRPRRRRRPTPLHRHGSRGVHHPQPHPDPRPTVQADAARRRRQPVDRRTRHRGQNMTETRQ